MTSETNPYEPSAGDVPVAEFSDPSSVIEIKGAITLKEARKALRIIQIRHPVVWFVLFMLMLGLLFLIVNAVQQLRNGAAPQDLWFTGSVFLFLILAFVFRLWRIDRILKSGKGVREPHRRVIDELGIATETAATNVQQKWVAFERVGHHGDIALLYIAGNKRMAMVFGRSMFEDDRQWMHFLELAERKVHG